MLPYPESPLILRYVAGGLFFALIYAGVIKYFERRLAFWQAYLISVVAEFVSGVAYTFAWPKHGLYPVLDLSADLAAMTLTGFMITRLAANYGIKKEGRLGLGAKVMFATMLLILIFLVALVGLKLLLETALFRGR